MAKRNYDEVNEDTVRPIRFWNAKEKRWVPHRFYAVENLRAHIGIYIESRRAEIGTTIEMIDTSKGYKLLAPYTRRVDGVEAPKGDDIFKLATKE